MYSLDPIHPIFSAIVEMIAIYPHSTIAELHAHLQKKAKVTISVPHLYRVVTRMVDAQILIKLHGKLSLNLMWVSYVEFIAARAKKIQQVTDEFPLREGEKKIYPANSLLDVEAIWNHVLVSLYRKLQEKELFKYYAHAWWQLGRNAEEISFYKQIKEQGVHCHWIFGNDTFLDQKGADRVREVFPVITLPDPPFPADGYNLNVYGEYVIECILPEKISKHFTMFFENVKSMEAFDQDLFLDIFAMRAKYKVTVWRNAKQAALLRETLAKHFA